MCALAGLGQPIAPIFATLYAKPSDGVSSPFTCMKVAAAVCGRAFALEGRGIWHALSVSAAQQVYGPVRARADLRFALESPPAAPSEDPGRATLEGAWKVGLGRGYF